METKRGYILIVILIVLLAGCKSSVTDFTETDKLVSIDPDYSDIVLPPNIAPLNFKIEEEATEYRVDIYSENGKVIQIKSKNGIVDIPISKWKKLLAENRGEKLFFSIYGKSENGWVKFPEIENTIANENIDSHLAFRILYPGYELWNDMGIYQRNLETFEQKPIIENKALGNDCVNCHSFAANSPETMMFHVRGKNGGTIVYSEGELKKRNIKVEGMPGGAVYPYWHPGGKMIAFSSNRIKQFFHSTGDKYIEVSDFISDLIVYDVEENIVRSDSSIATKEYMETFPTWSPDGKYLYYTRALPPVDEDLKNVRYNLMRIAFNATNNTWGQPETIYDAVAIGKSVAFPRISPDGKTLVFTMADYGNFTIWHNEADLYQVNLETNKTEILPVNSDWVESYHSWSSNGRWMVFSSKRRDTQCARPYFFYFDKNGKAHKPFIMPQKDPEFYDSFLRTYNIPELITGEVPVKEWDLIDAAHQDPVQAQAD
ncbi:hypothetical protein SLH46_15990 [Draconibacterium sp. IB214405]|uniref:TolB family protein n=1 Tax=Draconibacterium sp. IB214405 TaxID=3097352 RepID=UPI002A141DFD|nr:hypothetical protein [Draconibacterium sp. IB214405]MDX8340698.1 hypothetical protein [Draconibacterium sp. IB214405]